MAGGVDLNIETIRRRATALRRRSITLFIDGREWLRDHTERPRAAVRPVTGVVTPSAWVLLVMSIISLVAFFPLGWKELAIAGLFGLALLAASIVFILGAHQLSAALELSRDRVVVGERANGALRLTNESNHRTLPLTIELMVGRGQADFDLPSLPGKGTHDDLFAIPTQRRAILDVGPVLGVRSDPLGLLRREQVLLDSELLYVHPQTVPIEGSASGLVRDLEGQTVRKLADNDVAFHALRPYVPGDDRRYIHWKSTARTGTLMVRQFEETRRSHMLVVLSTRLDDYASDEEFETAVSVAASLGVQTIREGHTLTTTTSTRNFRQGSAIHLLDQFSGVDYERSAPPISGVARRISREHDGASVAVLVCGSLVEAAEIRLARRYLPLDVRTVVVQAHERAETVLRQMGDLDFATLGSLDDLGSTFRRLST